MQTIIAVNWRFLEHFINHLFPSKIQVIHSLWINLYVRVWIMWEASIIQLTQLNFFSLFYLSFIQLFLFRVVLMKLTCNCLCATVDLSWRMSLCWDDLVLIWVYTNKGLLVLGSLIVIINVLNLKLITDLFAFIIL